MKRACLGQNTTEFASSAKLYTYEQKHASSIRPLKLYFVRMKYYYSLVLLVFSSFVLGQINPKDDLLNQINGHYSNQIRERLAVAFHSDSISPGGNLIMHILTGSINQNLQPSYSRNIYIRLYFQNGSFLKSLQYKSTGLYNQLTMPVDPEWPAGMYFAAFYTDRMQNEPANVVPVKSFYIGNPDIKNESSTKDTSTFLNQSKNQAIEMFVSLISDSLVFEVFNPLMRKGMIALIRTNSQIHWSSEVPNKEQFRIKFPYSRLPDGSMTFEIWDSAFHLIAANKVEQSFRFISVSNDDTIISVFNNSSYKKAAIIDVDPFIAKKIFDEITFINKSDLSNHFFNIQLPLNALMVRSSSSILSFSVAGSKFPAFNSSYGIAGFIIDKNKKPVTNAIVEVVHMLNGITYRATSNLDGFFYIDLSKSAADAAEYQMNITPPFKKIKCSYVPYNILNDQLNDRILKMAVNSDVPFKLQSIKIPKSASGRYILTDADAAKDVLTIIRQIKPFTVTSNKILFYGNSSINFPEGALIYIDNIPQGSSIGVLQSIAVYDIESIQVLTSVSETQMYTAFASGGIIDIRTKRGKQKNISEVQKNFNPASFIISLPPKSSKIVSKYNKNSIPLIFIE